MLKFGFIGSGFAQFVIEPLLTIEGVKVTAIAARDEEKLKLVAQKFKIPHYYTDYHLMLQDPEVDVVVVSTPPALHFEHAKAALLAEKHVLIEKPVCINLADLDKLQLLAEEHKVKVGVNHMMRFNKLYKMLQELLVSQILDKPGKITFMNMASTLPDNHWFWDKDVSGGIFIEHGIHFFDLYNKIFGEGKLLSTARYTRNPDGAIEDRVHCSVEYPENLFIEFSHMFDQIPHHETTFALLSFPNGWIKIEGWSAHKMSGDLILNRSSIEKLRSVLAQSGTLQFVDAIGTPDTVMLRGSTLDDPISVKFEVLNENSVLDVYKHDTLALLENFCAAIVNNSEVETNLASVKTALQLAVEAAS